MKPFIPGTGQKRRTPSLLQAGAITLLLGSLLALSQGAAADTVYKSVQPDGSVLYSDKPPDPDSAASVQTIELPDYRATEVPNVAEMIDQMAATTERLRQDRKDREAARREQQPAPPVTYYPVPYRVQEPEYPDYIVPAYGFPPLRKPFLREFDHRDHHRNFPDHQRDRDERHRDTGRAIWNASGNR